MADKKKSINLLPGYLKTDKNAKFLSSTLDQFIQTPELERIDGFVGSKNTPNYDPSKDFYLKEDLSLRKNYALQPALVFKDSVSNITDVVGYDDIINELQIQGAKTENLDRLFRSKFYSFDPLIDWDKLVNYSEYYWLPLGPKPVIIEGPVDVESDIIGQQTYSMSNGYDLTNGMKVAFPSENITPTSYAGKEYIVEGVGSSIKLIDFSLLEANEAMAEVSNETFDGDLFDDYPFDGSKKLPLQPEYITINKASIDLNPWTRYNRWFHKEVIRISAEINNVIPTYPLNARAKRPIIEFKANIQLYNTGKVGIKNIDLMDTVTTDAFDQVDGTPGYYIDELLAEGGQRVIFNSDTDNTVRGKIYQIEFKKRIKINLVDYGIPDPYGYIDGSFGGSSDGVSLQEGQLVVFNNDSDLTKRGIIYSIQRYNDGSFRLVEVYTPKDRDLIHVSSGSLHADSRWYFNKSQSTWVKEEGALLARSLKYDPFLDSTVLKLVEAYDPNDLDSIAVNYGANYSGTEWHFNDAQKKWTFSQQHTELNQPPLFDLFDADGTSYTELSVINDFSGNKIFGYDIGTGTPDAVLGFPLKYQNSIGVGSYLFKNYFMTEIINLTVSDFSSTIPSGITFIKVYDDNQDPTLVNVWQNAEDYQIPIIEIQTLTENTSSLVVTAFDKPISQVSSIVSYVNDKKINSSFTLTNELTVLFDEELSANDTVLLKITTDQIPNGNGYYETPLSLTNNPLNGPITNMTLSELSDHLTTMVDKAAGFEGTFPGTSNLRDLSEYTKYGTRLIVNANPIAFAQMFLGKKEHNVVDSIRLIGDQYNSFKMSLMQQMSYVDSQLSPADALDDILREINKNKDNKSPFYRSDMLGYGYDKTIKTYTVSNTATVTYSTLAEFDKTSLSFKSLLVYLNDDQLIYGDDYTVDSVDETITITANLVVGDTIDIHYYSDTLGAYVPPTPSKLGMYPAFKPMLFNDESYLYQPTYVIRGHDGSIIKSFGDYRDDIILEYEKRVYNNIKVSYNSRIFDILSVIPGAFREDKYTIKDANDILIKDFLRWVGTYQVDYTTNDIYNDSKPFTWNYKGNLDAQLGKPVTGYWRGVYKYLFDTDKPHLAPWEMLGFAEEPSWWQDEYGPAPYDSSNNVWLDLVDGVVNDPAGAYTLPQYSRPGLLNILPVDVQGNLKSPDELMAGVNSFDERRSAWKFGDQGPAETVWRRSSYWPFALNAAAALLDPCSYTSRMYDLSRTDINQLDQVTYLEDDLYLNLTKFLIDGDNDAQIAGYGVYVVEKGKQKNINYIDNLKKDLTYLDFNLFYKLGGFASKDKLQISIDSIDPVSQSQGALLPPEDYSLILNVSNPVKSASMSGVIVQKVNGKFVVKGYDRSNPYFNVLFPVKTATAGAVTVGGVSESFSEWSGIVNNGASGLGSIDLTSASSNTTRYYKQGQLVRYNGKFYRVKVGHTAQTTFDPALFVALPALPIKGGASANLPVRFSKTVTQISYGTEYTTIQEVYDLLVGYGAWLETQGFIFDQYSTDLNELMDWKFTGKEFLYWTTQNWAENSVITLSPFAYKLKYQFIDSVVDNIKSENYEYSLLKADGKPFPVDNFKLTREDGYCIVETNNTEEGMFFVTLNSIQKEHAMVLNNSTIFNDTIYDIETGYKQRRIKLSGFRTANWNGDLFSPGFVYDSVEVTDWTPFQLYLPGKVVRYNGAYYESIVKVSYEETFDFSKWVKLPEKPVANLLPNFDYKISQFEDFYSLDIDNFDSDQQQLAQHLIGYSSRPYLNNIFTNPTTQYKFYQGFIKEKGTKNALDKISKAGAYTRQGSINFNEEWAFRVGQYGSFETYNEVEFGLEEGTSLENPYVVKFVETLPTDTTGLINYIPTDSLLIKPRNYSAESVFKANTDVTFEESNFELNTAGYARLDDITVTAYNKNSLLDIASNSLIKEGDTVWLGFLENGGWDIYRYSRQPAKISGVFVSSPASEITFVTDRHHGLNVGDIVSVVRFNQQVDGVYVVTGIPKISQFTVSSDLSTIINDELLAYGTLFKFESARFNNIEQIASKFNLLEIRDGEKVWIDNDINDRWVVYQKTANYTTSTNFAPADSPSGQRLGFEIYTNEDSNVLLTSAPGWILPASPSYGRVWVYDKTNDILTKQYEYLLNTETETYSDPAIESEFGYSLAIDNGKGLFIAGAPAATNVVRNTQSANTVVISTGTGTLRSYIQEGVVKISRTDPTFIVEEQVAVICHPNAYTSTNGNYARFGHSVYVNQVSSTSSTMLLVGAPGSDSHATSGKVYAYILDQDSITSEITVSAHPTGIVVNSTASVSLSANAKWGETISGSTDGSIIAISALGHVASTTTGVIQIFDQDLTWKQSIYTPFETNDPFGTDVVVSPSGDYLLVSSTSARDGAGPYGKVAIYSNSTAGYVLNQILVNPLAATDLRFGSKISISNDETVLTISSLGTNRSSRTRFDIDSKDGETLFDGDTTRFYESVPDTGAVYVYNKLGNLFVAADELITDLIEGSKFGYSLITTNDSIYVGAPASTTATPDDSSFYQFTKVDKTINSWNILREQDNSVDVSLVKKINLIDTFNEEIIDYLDIIDPLKGKIAGIADQEIRHKSVFDPAIYTIGISSTNVDTESSWIDEHVGELWWDLSTVKYIWYEQGDDIFRKNNWGKIFPGSSIDVYEWVKSDLLPTEWASQADTTEGLTKGISGQPKYPDNSVVSVKQVYNSITNSFESVYYFWVKNKVTVPDSLNRRISGYDVASLISDPVANGLKFVEILSSTSIALANVQPSLVGNRINAHIVYDSIDNQIPRHTEWMLLQEGNPNTMPNSLLNKKLIDSLLGHDIDGKLVPAAELSYRERYGLGIRPQQTIFKDRLEALRNQIQYANSILIKNRITGNYSFENLNKAEEIPNALDGEYDLIVDDESDINNIETINFVRAELECFTLNGKIRSVNIINPGFGYSLPPKITIDSETGSGQEITSEIDSQGRVVAINIVNAGNNFAEESPTITARAHTVIVNANSNYGGKWTKHVFDYNAADEANPWIRIKVQAYNTPLYWNYVDWVADEYSPYKDYKYVVDDPYQLSELVDIMPGDYVKVNNIGSNRYVILEKLSASEFGNFSKSYNIVYSERGTFQILDDVWNYLTGDYAYDAATLEETLYDQIPDLEVFYILLALKDNIFIKDLKDKWNLFFFKAVKYALTEQKLLDWAFKTSFITVNNVVGELDQRPVYKLDNEEFYENYVKEIKPYHTKIRNYTSNYSVLDGDNYASEVIDFDLPSYFNTATDSYQTVSLGNSLLSEYPWRWWAENYKYHVDRIEVANPGAGYTQRPTVTITTAPGDTGSGATAEAYIRSGKVFRIVVTNPGSGYVIPPIVSITGGGNYVTSTATVSPIMYNGTIRKNIVGMKFDRVSSRSELDNLSVTDTFICSGVDQGFELTWVAAHDKLTISATLDGKLILATDYTIEYYTRESNGYSKKFSKFKFINSVPTQGQLLKITYYKDVDLYHAVDRIRDYYSPTSGMPENNLVDLMSGVEYENTIYRGLPFEYSPSWGYGVFDGSNSAWSDLVEYYVPAKIVNTLSVIDSTLYLDDASGIVPGQVVNILSSSTIRVKENTVVTAVDTLTNTVNISRPQYQIKWLKPEGISPGSTIEVKTMSPFFGAIEDGDLVTLTNINESGYNGTYQIQDILGNDRFTILAASGITTGTVRPTNALATVSAILEPVSQYVEIDKIVQTSWGRELVTLTSVVSYQDIKKVDVWFDGTQLNSAVIFAEYYSTSTSTGVYQVTVHNVGILADHTVEAVFYGNPTVEFWKPILEQSNLDTVVRGGNWNNGIFTSALGINPEDVIVDGAGLYGPENHYGPEERVPGHTLDSLGLNVYTRENDSRAMIFTGATKINSSLSATTVSVTFPIGDDTAGFMAHYNGVPMSRTTSTVFTNNYQFYISGNSVTIPPQPNSAMLCYSAITAGGDGVIDSNMIVVENTTEAAVTGLASIDGVRSVYVLVDGQPVAQTSTSTQYGYQLTTYSNNDYRATVRLYGLSTARHIIQVWFFNSEYTQFNRINEEVFVVDSTPRKTFPLSTTIGELEPASAMVIVEDSGVRKMPPWISYYKVENNQNVYQIDNRNNRSGQFSIDNTRVYLNGRTLRPGFDYTVQSGAETVTILPQLLTTGDAIAVMGLNNYEYYVENNVLVFYNNISEATIKVTSFSDHDSLFMRTEKFNGRGSNGIAYRRFTLSDPVFNENYIWVYVSGKYLTPRYDFELLTDRRTVQISEWIDMPPYDPNSTDLVVITSFNPPTYGDTVLGYRQFKDLFGRHHFTRLAKFYTTTLTRELLPTDTEIHVADASKLIPPNPARNKPGVVIIDSERIEWFTKIGNVLTDLRRSTLGTGPAKVSLEGTKVIDQSLQQNIPYVDLTSESNMKTFDVVLVQNTLTTTTSSYVITTVTNTTTSQGIVLMTETGNGKAVPNLEDQITVLYGGRELRKSSLVVHDSSIAYDNTSSSLVTLEPEFDVSINGNNQVLTLNIENGVTPGVMLSVVKKVSTFWTGTESLLTSERIQAEFLRRKQAELPDIYYYGGDETITEENYVPITDNNDDPLEGI